MQLKSLRFQTMRWGARRSCGWRTLGLRLCGCRVGGTGTLLFRDRRCCFSWSSLSSSASLMCIGCGSRFGSSTSTGSSPGQPLSSSSSRSSWPPKSWSRPPPPPTTVAEGDAVAPFDHHHPPTTNHPSSPQPRTANFLIFSCVRGSRSHLTSSPHSPSPSPHSPSPIPPGPRTWPPVLLFL